MGKLCMVIIAMTLLLSCASNEGKTRDLIKDSASSSQKKSPAADYLKIDGDSIIIPSFTIEVRLTEMANTKLAADRETIIVAAWFSGSPKDTASREYKESGELFLKSTEIELHDSSRTASFEGIKFSKASYDSLADKDIRVLINVFSGRKSSPDNLLDCAILADNMSAVKGKKFVLAGKLIGEADSSLVK